MAETPQAKSRRESPPPSSVSKPKRAKIVTRESEAESSAMNMTGLPKAACDAICKLVVDIDTASQSSESTSAPAAVQLNHNAAYMKKLEAEIATVLEKVPELTKASQPLTTEQGSDISPWSPTEFLKQF